MDVAELIAALSALPPDLLVMVSGYESGLTANMDAPRVAKVAGNGGVDPYAGEFDEDPNGAAVVVIERAGMTLAPAAVAEWRGGARECQQSHKDGRCGCDDPENGNPAGYCAVGWGGDR